jgi:hypothetical protein
MYTQTCQLTSTSYSPPVQNKLQSFNLISRDFVVFFQSQFNYSSTPAEDFDNLKVLKRDLTFNINLNIKMTFKHLKNKFNFDF